MKSYANNRACLHANSRACLHEPAKNSISPRMLWSDQAFLRVNFGIKYTDLVNTRVD